MRCENNSPTTTTFGKRFSLQSAKNVTMFYEILLALNLWKVLYYSSCVQHKWLIEPKIKLLS